MTSQIEFTFTWPESAADPALTPLTLSIKCEELAARDPKGLSLLSVKIRESGNKVVCQASGPGEDEYMSPSLIQFVWQYASSGSLICPADCEVNSPFAQAR